MKIEITITIAGGLIAVRCETCGSKLNTFGLGDHAQQHIEAAADLTRLFQRITAFLVEVGRITGRDPRAGLNEADYGKARTRVALHQAI